MRCFIAAGPTDSEGLGGDYLSLNEAHFDRSKADPRLRLTKRDFQITPAGPGIFVTSSPCLTNDSFPEI